MRLLVVSLWLGSPMARAADLAPYVECSEAIDWGAQDGTVVLVGRNKGQLGFYALADGHLYFARPKTALKSSRELGHEIVCPVEEAGASEAGVECGSRSWIRVFQLLFPGETEPHRLGRYRAEGLSPKTPRHRQSLGSTPLPAGEYVELEKRPEPGFVGYQESLKAEVIRFEDSIALTQDFRVSFAAQVSQELSKKCEQFVTSPQRFLVGSKEEAEREVNSLFSKLEACARLPGLPSMARLLATKRKEFLKRSGNGGVSP